MDFLRKLFGSEPQNKDLQYYANRLSGQMFKISKVGIRIESYLPKAYQNCTNRDFIEAALSSFKSVGGKPGDGAIEIYRDIEKDIETMQSFLNDWRESANTDTKVVVLAKDLCLQLEKLKEYIEDTPPEMMAGCKKLVVQKKAGGYT